MKFSSQWMVAVALVVGCSDQSRLDWAAVDQPNGLQSGDRPPAVPQILACESGAVVVRAGESRDLSWTINSPDPIPLTMSLSKQSNPPGSFGTIITLNETSVRYYAPAKNVAVNAFDVSVIARSEERGLEVACGVRVLPDKDLGVPDDGITEGLKGDVYWLDESTQKLPDFSRMTPQFSMITPNLSISGREWTTGFPGVDRRDEWFGIRFQGQLIISQTGRYKLKINSDDGSMVYIDDELVIDNDGLHGEKAIESRSIQLSAGSHKIRVDYFQGPRTRIALELFWVTPSQSSYGYVPASAFRRPK